MYAGTTSETGQQRYAGAMFGSEAFFNPNFADNGGYGPFIGHYVYSSTEWTLANWREKINFSTVYDHSKEVLSPVTAAPSPDITAFVNRGGKLLHYHGWGDSVVPPNGSVDYFFALTQFEKLRHLPRDAFDRQIEKLTPQVVAATAQAFGKQVQEYHRLFLLPAVSHCGGGTGPDSIGGGAPEPPAALPRSRAPRRQRGDAVGRGRRGARKDHRHPLRYGRHGRAAAPALRVPGAGGLQRIRQHR